MKSTGMAGVDLRNGLALALASCGSARGNGEIVENGTVTAGSMAAEPSSVRLRVASVIAALALMFAMFALVQDRAEASPAGGAAVAASIVSFGGVDAAQIDVGALIRQIACPILISIRSTFAGSAFFGFITPTLNSLIIGFGCAPS